MAKATMGYGPISPGVNCPSVKTFSGDPGEHQMGTAMHPGFDHTAHAMTRRTSSKHKAYSREPVPKTPRG